MSSSSDDSTLLEKNSKTEISVAFQPPFLCPSNGHQHGVPLLGYNVFPNISRMIYRTDLILGEDICLFFFFHFPDFRRSVCNGLMYVMVTFGGLIA